jgi:mRNA interferase RelE/StbE
MRRRILLAIGSLNRDPRGEANVKAMKGQRRYRLRVGDWRVIYELHDDLLLILVVPVGHRREVYR